MREQQRKADVGNGAEHDENSINLPCIYEPLGNKPSVKNNIHALLKWLMLSKKSS